MWLFGLFGKKVNRNLNEVWEGELEITIEGVGSKRMNFERSSLSTCVAMVSLHFGGDCIVISSNRKSPWQILSFDRENKVLVVKPV